MGGCKRNGFRVCKRPNMIPLHVLLPFCWSWDSKTIQGEGYEIGFWAEWYKWPVIKARESSCPASLEFFGTDEPGDSSSTDYCPCHSGQYTQGGESAERPSAVDSPRRKVSLKEFDTGWKYYWEKYKDEEWNAVKADASPPNSNISPGLWFLTSRRQPSTRGLLVGTTLLMCPNFVLLELKGAWRGWWSAFPIHCVPGGESTRRRRRNENISRIRYYSIRIFQIHTSTWGVLEDLFENSTLVALVVVVSPPRFDRFNGNILVSPPPLVLLSGGLWRLWAPFAFSPHSKSSSSWISRVINKLLSCHHVCPWWVLVSIRIIPSGSGVVYFECGAGSDELSLPL